VCAWLAVASEAKSATVTFHADGYENVVRYVAAPGERNNLHIDHAGASVTLTDAGATLKAGRRTERAAHASVLTRTCFRASVPC
jgi:hypothetical protein